MYRNFLFRIRFQLLDSLMGVLTRTEHLLISTARPRLTALLPSWPLSTWYCTLIEMPGEGPCARVGLLPSSRKHGLVAARAVAWVVVCMGLLRMAFAAGAEKIGVLSSVCERA